MRSSAAADAAGIGTYLARFVPNHRRQLLRRRHGGEPVVRTLDAAVLYVDIVGFTSLTGQMTQHLAVGAEQVAADVNRVLTGIAAIAASHGGEVIHFAGDAAWIGWFVEAPAALSSASRLAAGAAIAVREAARSWLVGGRPVELRASLGAGDIEQLELGGEGDRWHGLFRGGAIGDAASADRFASAGIIVASPAVSRHLRDIGHMFDLPQGYARVQSISAAAPPDLPASAEMLAGLDGAALPPMIAYRAASGEPSQWSGEFRTCHIVFGRLEMSGTADSRHLHLAVGEIQRALDRSNGSLYQLLSDEKGVAVIAAYGLPPQASGADAPRALEAVVSLHEALRPLGVESRFGMAAGRTFCTVYGAGDQLQFALVGPALNRAARLADGPEAVLADATIAAAPPLTLGARRLPPRALKGLPEPVAVSEIVRRHDERPNEVAATPIRLIGREGELARGLARIADLADGRGGLLLIEGDPGAGKSALAATLIAAAARSLSTARGLADEIERATEYRPWRAALGSLLSGLLTADRRLSGDALATLGGLRQYAGLLSRVLDLAPGQDVSAQPLTDEARAGLIRQMVAALLAVRLRDGPIVLLLEDLHWFDSPSLALLATLLDAHLPMLIIATARPEARVDELFVGSGRERLALGSLDPTLSAALLAQVAEAPSVEELLGMHVHAISAGNPFFITQLARFLLDNGRLRLERGRLTAVDDTLSLDRAFEAHGVPATLEGVVMGRLDALPPADREIVRAASVLGGSFGHADLAALLGAAPNLAPLVQAGILAHDGGEVAFRHAILRDVAYSTLSLADRRQLHGAVAQLLAARPEAAAGQLDAVLAHHLEQAGDLDGAIAHLLRAGTASLRANANREALVQHTHALALLRSVDTARRSARRDVVVDLEFGAGEAAQRLSLYDEAVRHKDMALAELGGAIPRSVWMVAPALLREVATQFAHRRLPWLVGGRRPSAIDLRLSAETGELVEIYFYGGESLRSLYAALRALNLAEGGGDTPQLARGFGIVGTIAGFARLGGVARSYGERALDVLSRIDDAAAAWWVPLVVGVSRLSAGDLPTASRLMDMTAAAAERIRDRRHWRDAIGSQSIILGLRGNWEAGLELSESYGATALEDRDARYIVGAAREQAYFLLQLGRLDEAESRLARVRTELDRGFRAEAAASRQDLHAIGAAIAMARGDAEQAQREAEAGLAVFLTEAKGSSFPNMFWSLEVLFDVFMRLSGSEQDIEWYRRNAWTLVRALDRHAAAHLIGRPAALRARGLYERRFGWAARAGRWLDRGARTASALGMAYASEPALASGPTAPLARFIPAWLRRACSR